MPKQTVTDYEYEPPELTGYQRAILYGPERFTVTEASTKVGKTSSHIVWLFERAALTGGPGKNYWWVAPVYEQARIAFNRMKRYVDRTDFFTPNESRLSLTLPNGAVISFKSAEKPDNLFGEDVYDAVFDEASRAREDAWFALRSTLTATRGKCKFIANVRGRGWYYKLAQRAKNGTDDEYAYHKITAWDAVDAGILDRSEVEQAKRDLPEHVFRELYEAEPSDDGGNPFGVQFLDAAKREYVAIGPAVSIGVDLAKSVDYTVFVGLNEDKAVCYLERFQLNWTLTQETILALPDVPTEIDATGVGNPIVEEAQRYRRFTTGFTFTAPAKQQLIEALAIAIRRGEMTYPGNTPLEDELYSFEYIYTRTGVRYSAPPGLHDDCVMALALAYHQWRNQPIQHSTARASRPQVRPPRL